MSKFLPMTAFPSTRLEFLTSMWLVQCQEEQAQPAKPLEAEAPRMQFDFETINTELSSSWWPKQVLPKACALTFFSPDKTRNLDFLAIRRQRSARALCSRTQVPQASKCHLGTNPAPLWLGHVIQLPLEGPRHTEAILLEFALPLYLPSAKDMLPVSYLHLSAFISQPWLLFRLSLID